MIGWFINSMWRIMRFAVVALLLLVLGISYYVNYAGLHPTKSNETDNYTFMYSEYPYLRRWCDSLKRKRALQEEYILEPANRPGLSLSDLPFIDLPEDKPDSIKLHAYYIKAKKPTTRTAIVVHGHRSSAIGMLHIAYMYNRMLGYNVLLPELRTHGKSEGNHIQMGWFDRKDLLSWCNEANRLFTYKDSKGLYQQPEIVLHGISMGAATVMMTVGDENLPHNVRCAVEDCGYTSVWEQFSYVASTDYGVPQFPVMQLASLFCKWQYGWDFKEASPLDQIMSSDLPMLFIHGTSDTYVPTEMVHKLYQAKPRNKHIWLSEGSLHARSYHDHPREYTRQVKAFIDSYLYFKK